MFFLFLSSETDLPREARSAPSTVVCATIRRQRPSVPSFRCGELVRITKGDYKNDIGERRCTLHGVVNRIQKSHLFRLALDTLAIFERSLPNGWSEVSSYPPGIPSSFWVETEFLTTRPRAVQPKKRKKKHRVSAQKLESIFAESIDQCFQYVKTSRKSHSYRAISS